MSEPQRQSKPAAEEEPAGGIGAPQTVPPERAAASAQQSDPGGYPHQPAAPVPDVPGDEPLQDHDRRRGDQTGEEAGPGDAAGDTDGEQVSGGGPDDGSGPGDT